MNRECRQWNCGSPVGPDHVCARCGYDQVGCFYWGTEPTDEWLKGEWNEQPDE